MSLAPLPAIRNDKENAAVKRHSSLSTDESTIPGRVLRCADTNVCQETQFSHVEKPTLAYGVEAKGQPLARRVDPATDGGGDTATTTTTVHQVGLQHAQHFQLFSIHGLIVIVIVWLLNITHRR